MEKKQLLESPRVLSRGKVKNRRTDRSESSKMNLFRDDYTLLLDRLLGNNHDGEVNLKLIFPMGVFRLKGMHYGLQDVMDNIENIKILQIDFNDSNIDLLKRRDLLPNTDEASNYIESSQGKSFSNEDVSKWENLSRFMGVKKAFITLNNLKNCSKNKLSQFVGIVLPRTCDEVYLDLTINDERKDRSLLDSATQELLNNREIKKLTLLTNTKEAEVLVNCKSLTHLTLGENILLKTGIYSKHIEHLQLALGSILNSFHDINNYLIRLKTLVVNVEGSLIKRNLHRLLAVLISTSLVELEFSYLPVFGRTQTKEIIPIINSSTKVEEHLKISLVKFFKNNPNCIIKQLHDGKHITLGYKKNDPWIMMTIEYPSHERTYSMIHLNDDSNNNNNN